MVDISREKLLDMLETMYTIRYFEQKADELFGRGKIHGTMHLSIGQEATAVGSIAPLRPNDYIASTHRGHGHCLAKGADVRRMMAEFLGKETGYCRGRGGSMHIADVEAGNLGATGVVGGGIPTAVGAALASKLTGDGKVTVCFFGDGAANLGIFHEGLNMAAIWKLPVVFVCENNQYGMSMPVERSMPVKDVAERAASYAMPGVVVDGNDVLQIYEAVSEAVKRAREGRGPSLIECKTYRWKGHSKSDQERYRTREEVEAWKKKDPIARFQKWLIEKGIATEQEIEAISARARQTIEDAVTFAEESPEPSPDTILEGVYAE